jgi:hypothetical protein
VGKTWTMAPGAFTIAVRRYADGMPDTAGSIRHRHACGTYDASWPDTARQLTAAGYTWPQALWALGLIDDEGLEVT